MAAPAVRRPTAVETDDVQALVLQGYGKLRAAAYLVLGFDDAERARSWLRSVLDEFAFGDARPSDTAVNLALTATGLDRLGLTAGTLTGFSPEFCEGMTSPHRTRLLGDQGAAAPTNWSWGAPDGPPVDALLLLFARTPDQLDALLDRHRERLSARSVRELAVLETTDIGFGEHFGFRDGLSQPSIAGVGQQSGPLHTLAAGEFLLGYLNEHGQLPRSPLVAATADPQGHLPSRPRGPAGASAPVSPGLQDARDLGRNGSYLVVRTLAQDVGAFWRYADGQTHAPDGSPDPDARIALAARMVGRWPSGAPVTRTPDRDQPGLATQNDFGYHADDEAGTRCPIGAHVRRTNPRDSLPPEPGSDDSVAVNKRHRLIRRGRTYGPAVDPAQAMTEDPTTAPDRGLHFLALCSDIARQFEFVSHTWAMNPSFAGLLDDADPMLGGHTGRGTSFTVQRDPVRRRHRDVPAFVTPRGGAYFFLPGGRALRYLAGA